MPSLPNLVWIRSFEAASRLGSFTAAGTELGLTQAAVSTHVSALETQLGHQLLERTTRKVDLTASGKAYLPAVRKALQELATSTEGLFGSRSTGTVTIRAPISEAALIMAPALADFRRQHPGLDIRLLSAIWADTVLETGIDIEIRLGTGNWPDSPAEPLGPEVIVPVCHPEMAASLNAPEDLLAQPRIHVLGFDDHWPRYLEACGLPRPERHASITVDTSLAAVELAAAHGGIALLLGKVAARPVANGRLSVPLDIRVPSARTHHLLSRTPAVSPKTATQTVEAWIRELFAG
ncbi:LysR substrate-binding domain-containing protein [Roseibium sp.]|uniref:LysR substrate-binding domain-containing protein n=1 Tax=Roseibium sp. TaxID=1936156 RepID=UPI0032644BA9